MTAERITAVLVVLTAGACSVDRHPPGGGPGGPNGGGGGRVDAMPASDAPPRATVSGQVCTVADLRFPLACPATERNDIEVGERASSSTATTSTDGSFSLTTSASGRTVLIVGGDDQALHDSLVVVPLDDQRSAQDVIAPVVAETEWTDLLAAVGVVEPDGSGALALYIRSDETPVMGSEVIPPQGTAFAPYYDRATATSWDQVGLTGERGAALVFGVPAGLPEVSFTVIGPQGFATAVITDAPIASEAITFMTIELPSSR